MDKGVLLAMQQQQQQKQQQHQQQQQQQHAMKRTSLSREKHDLDNILETLQTTPAYGPVGTFKQDR